MNLDLIPNNISTWNNNTEIIYMNSSSLKIEKNDKIPQYFFIENLVNIIIKKCTFAA